MSVHQIISKMKYLREPAKEATPPDSRLNFNLKNTSIAPKVFSSINRLRIIALLSNIGLRTLSQLKYADDPQPGTYSPESRSHEEKLAEQQKQLEILNEKLKQLNEQSDEKFPKYNPK